MIAFYGMGLLGSNFVRALRKRGEDVTVWNRSPERARKLAAETGARAALDPAEAARGAARVHLTLSDDAAVDDVLARAQAGFGPRTMIVDHTTTTPAGTAARASRFAGLGLPFLHAPVFMGPKQALESTGVMITSGPRERHDALEPALAKMTGKLHWLGPAPERAAALKLMGNALGMMMTVALADTVALGRTFGVPRAELEAIFTWLNPGASLPARLDRLIGADLTQPSWELAMARKDVRLMHESAAEAGLSLLGLGALAEAMDRALAEGHAAHDWTVFASPQVRG